MLLRCGERDFTGALGGRFSFWKLNGWMSGSTVRLGWVRRPQGILSMGDRFPIKLYLRDWMQVLFRFTKSGFSAEIGRYSVECLENSGSGRKIVSFQVNKMKAYGGGFSIFF